MSNSPINQLLATVKWERIIWPEDVEEGQEWTEKRTGRRVQVEGVSLTHADVRNMKTGRRSTIYLIDLCSRFIVDQSTLSEELRRVPPPAKE